MNTLFSYMYRDAANYKFHKEVIIKGELILEEIKPYLHEHDFFIPSAVGLPDLQPEILNINDHVWHEIVSILETDVPPNCAVTSKELKARFISFQALGWDESKIFARKFSI